MSQEMNLKEAESKVLHLTFQQDGLLDIMFGLLMLGSGIRSLADSVWFTLIAIAGIPIYVMGKMWITTPRLGHVKYSTSQTRRMRGLKVMVGLAVLVTFALMAIRVLTGWAPSAVVIGATLVVTVTLILWLTAYVWNFRRMYAYGLLIGTSMALTEAVSLDTGSIGFCISGSIALLIGLIVFVRFLSEYPIRSEDSTAAGTLERGR